MERAVHRNIVLRDQATPPNYLQDSVVPHSFHINLHDRAYIRQKPVFVMLVSTCRCSYLNVLSFTSLSNVAFGARYLTNIYKRYMGSEEALAESHASNLKIFIYTNAPHHDLIIDYTRRTCG
jgi:hypothetical protein